MQNDPESRIEQMKKKLYSPKSEPGLVINKKRSPLPDQHYEVEEKWPHEAGSFQVPLREQPNRGSLLNKIFIGSLIFFVLSVAVAVFMFYGGFNRLSSNNIDISIVSPVSVTGGEELALHVTVHNNNKTMLKEAELSIEYPLGTRNPADLKTDLLRDRQVVGDLESGKSKEHTFKSVFFGEENSKKEIVITLEYKVPGSSSTYFKEKKYEILLASSPVSVSLDYPKEVNSNQEVEFNISVVSNSPSAIENLLLKVDYPFGFVYKTASQSPLYQNTTWKLGTMRAGEKRTIRLRGIIEGQDGEEKVLRFTAGVESEQDEKIIDVPFVSTFAEIFIRKPFVGVNFKLNGVASREYVSMPGEELRGEIEITNNLPSDLIEPQIELALNGLPLDESKINVERGFYRSNDNRILWNKSTESSLAQMRPGDTRRLNFSFSSYPNLSQVQSFIKNPEISLEVVVKGKKIEGADPEEVVTSLQRMVKFSTALSGKGESLHATGLFQNSGPIPPKAENKTTYTIVWKVFNSSNHVSNATIRATLPVYVNWLNKSLPTAERISYNENAREVVWSVGEVPAYTGVSTKAKEVSFQVELFPSLSQLGEIPVLVNEATLKGEDRFTLTAITVKIGAITTGINDPGASEADSRVVK